MTSKISLIVIPLLISSCTFLNRDVVMQSVDFNESLARATNQVYLTNILRAMDHEPMLLTSLTTVRGNLKYSATTGDLTIPFGGGSDNKYSIAPKLSAELNPSFDMALLDGAKFYKGFLHPVDDSIINYYLDQGWPQQFLLTLLIRQLEIPKKSFEDWLKVKDRNTVVDAKGEWKWPDDSKARQCKPVTKDNKVVAYRCVGYPMNDESWRGYESAIKNLKVEAKEPKSCIGPEFSTLSAAVIAKLHVAGLRIKKITTQIKNSTPLTTQITYCVYEPKSFIKYNWQWGKKLAARLILMRSDSSEEKEEDGAIKVKDEGAIFIRSPEAVLYFLGEVVRRQVDTGTYDKHDLLEAITIPTFKYCPREPLFILEPTSVGADAIPSHDYLITVDYKNLEYGVPYTRLTSKGCLELGGRTMHALTLVHQLVGLFKEKAELSVTPSVLSIN